MNDLKDWVVIMENDVFMAGSCRNRSERICG